jgi:hypothetical protein
MTEAQDPLTPTLLAGLVRSRRWLALDRRMGADLAFLRPRQQRRLIRSVAPEQLATDDPAGHHPVKRSARPPSR